MFFFNNNGAPEYRKSLFPILLIALTLVVAFLVAGCGEKKERKLVVYSGKGLQRAMEDITQAFEQKHKIRLNVIYSGSKSAVNTIEKTKRGDVFIPGSTDYIGQVGEMVLHHQYVALHWPIVVVQKDNDKNIQSFEDLAKPGISIAMGDKNMCACGLIAEQIVVDSGFEKEITQNVVVTGSTVTELFNLVLTKEVDASIIWSDMLQWPEAGDLKRIEIPAVINKAKNIHVAVLTTTTDRESADLFADFVATEGKDFFRKHGFGEK